MAKVSVIVPVFNGADSIGRALDSVFAQTLADFEVVVTDDGSTDSTRAILDRYGARIRVVSQPNRGPSAARNAGINASNAKYVAFLDADDEWMPEMLERCAALLDRDLECMLVYVRALKIDLAGLPMPNQDNQTNGVDSPTLKQMFERPWNVWPSQFMVRRTVLESCGGFDERLKTGEDLFFLLLAREHGYFRYISESLVRKTTRPLYPTALKREQQSEIFVRMVRERHGDSAKGLIREYQLSRVKVMKHMARILMEEGRPREARQCLARVIHYRPASPKAYRRYLKTFFSGALAAD